jgi:acyl-CoA synthetase (AMP-forming)/AMP-acid ligase II
MYEEKQEFPLTYSALWKGALGYAAQLTQAGLQPGQMVAIMLPTCKEYLYSFYGVLLAGGVPVPLYPPARLTTIEDHMTRHVGILKSAGATIMITVPEAKALAWLLRAQVESLRTVLVPPTSEGSAAGFAPVRGKPGDIGFLQYTSGSTGSPKGVVLSHANLMANVRAMGAAGERQPARRVRELAAAVPRPRAHRRKLRVAGAWFSDRADVAACVPLAPGELDARDSSPPRHDVGRPEFLLRAVPATHHGRGNDGHRSVFLAFRV